MPRCGKYMGDNDATSPEIVCIRGRGHPWPCDNVHCDFQVWATQCDGSGDPFPISFVYASRHDAERVRVASERLLPGLFVFMMNSEGGDIHYGNETKRCIERDEAAELFRRFGW